MITEIEKRYYERVPNLLHSISESLEAIACSRSVFVFTAEQSYDYDNFDVVVKVLATEQAAQEFLHKFVNDGGSDVSDVIDESIAAFVERNGWDVEHDDPDFYLAYVPGSYAEGHVECRITECKIEK